MAIDSYDLILHLIHYDNCYKIGMLSVNIYDILTAMSFAIKEEIVYIAVKY